MTSTENLRHATLKGGAYLAARQVISIALKTIGVLVITRMLGPASYGAYIAAFNIYQYGVALGSAGIGVYLLRQAGVVSDKAYDTAYTILLSLSLVLVAAFEIGRNFFSDRIGVDGFAEVAALMVWALPFQLLTIPAAVRLERGLNYRAVAFQEIAGQACFYAVGVPLVLLGFGAPSLGAAWLVQMLVCFVIAHVMSRTYPRFGFDRRAGFEIFGYAGSFSIANWVWQLRMLVNPLIVGPALGAQAVGYVGMTIGLLEMLSIIKTIAWRLSVAVLGRVQADFDKLRKAVTEGMELQTLAVGTILLGFGWTGHILVPLLFGERWAPVMDIYPYIAVSYLTVTPFNMHSAALSVINRNRDLAVAFVVHILLFAGTVYVAVPHFGMAGYGYGELAALPAYLLVHLSLTRAIGSPDYRLTTLWWTATVIGLFWSRLGLWAIAVPFLALAMPMSLRRLADILKVVLRREAVA